MRHYEEAPPRDRAKRWGRVRNRFTHNLETEPGLAAQVDVLAEHWNITKVAALARIINAYVMERPTYHALLQTELPQVEVAHVE